MKRDVASFCLITFIVLAFFFRLFWPEPHLLVTPDFGRSDAWHFTFVTKFLLGKSLHKGTLPVWIPELGRGFPLLAEGQTGTFFLPNLILYRLFDAVTAYNVSIIFAILMLGWGMYVWLRFMKYHPLAAFFGSITLAFSGMVIAQLPHNALVQGVSLLPWVMYATLRLFQKKSRHAVALWSFLFSEQLLTGFPQAAFITLFFATGYGSWLLIASKTKTADSFRFIFSFLAALGLSAMQILPSWEFLAQTTVARGIAPDTASYFSYPLKHLITLIHPFAPGNPKFGTYPPFFAFDGSIFWENVGGVGLIPVILAIFVLIKRTWSRTLFFVLTLFASFVLMLGKYSPLYLLYSFWPFNLFRVPSRFIWVFVISILILAAHGVQMLWQTKRARILLRGFVILCIITNTIFLYITWYSYHAFEPARVWLSMPKTVSSLPRDAYIFTIGAEAAHNQSFLPSGWRVMEPYVSLRDTLPPNSASLWGVTATPVYAGRFLRRPSAFDDMLAAGLEIGTREATLSGIGKKFIDLAGVNSVISAIPLTQTGQIPLTQQSANNAATVWNNRQAVPITYLATRVFTATTKEEAFAVMKRDDFIPGQSVLLETPLPQNFYPEDTSSGRVVLSRDSETSVTISVTHNDGDAVLVLTDTYYPGWQATLDGQPVPILPANIKQRGVVIPRGDHEIRFFYEPKSLIRGAVISGFTLLVLLIIVVFPPVFSTVHTHPKAMLPYRRRPRSRVS